MRRSTLNHNAFNRDIEKSMKRTGIAFGVAWFFFLLFDLAIVAGVIYIVLHFVGKYW